MYGANSILEAVRRLQSSLQGTGGTSQNLENGHETLQRYPLAAYDFMIVSPELRGVSRDLYRDGYYVRAVEEAYKLVNNLVKERAGLNEDGQALMLRAYSEQNPALKINDMKSESQKNEQAGYSFILAGCMRGIRNPRAHEHDLRDDPVSALEMLIWANHLIGVVNRSKRVRMRKKKNAH
ncbi:MAG: TIGR02391 family protein [Dehalococcoidia bacterium]